MSVRDSLLAILNQGACYGHQLRSEFDARTGGATPLNIGQVYNTLERLERDGLVRRGETDEHGHAYWHITSAGSDAATAWLSATVPPSSAREELPLKVALTATLPGGDAPALLADQQAVAKQRYESLTATREAAVTLSEQVLAEWASQRALAELRWLERVDDIIRNTETEQREVPLNQQPPRRGRPRKAQTDV